jgi:hypothetical protein
MFFFFKVNVLVQQVLPRIVHLIYLPVPQQNGQEFVYCYHYLPQRTEITAQDLE